MNNSLAPVQWLIFLSLFRMSYEFSNAGKPSPSAQYLIEKDIPGETLETRQQEWANKAVKRYAAAQDKKWERWNEAMFEKVT